MDAPVDWDLLARYLTGQCSPEETEELEHWIAGDAARAELVASMRRAWEASGTVPPPLDLDAAWTRLSERVGLRLPAEAGGAAAEPRERRVVPFPAPRPRVPAGRRFSRVAAAAVAVAALGAALWQATLRPDRAADPFADARTYATQAGQRAEMRLPDGTRIVLSVASTLRVPESYGDDTRSVALEGEAYFEVTHDDARPFRVHTERAVATDLGTRFGVRAYAGDDITVVVREGAVSLRPAAAPRPGAAPSSDPEPSRSAGAGAQPDSVVLARGDLGRVGADGRLTAERGVAMADYLAWTDGRLVLADVPLDQAVAQLNRWYDLDIRLADDSLGQLRITGEFATEPVSDILRFLTAPLGLEYERQGRVITLRRK